MTDEQRSDPKLVLRAEALVAKISSEEPDWEALAARVSARLTDAKEPDDALLAAPFPEVEGESALDRLVSPKQAAPVAADSAGHETLSLADLARASVARRGGREAANIAKESLAVASQTRAQGERSAERVAAGTPTPAPSSRRATASLSDSRGPWIGVAIATVGLAAGFGLYFAGQRRGPELVSHTAPVVSVAAIAEAKAEPQRTTPSQPTQLAPAPAAQAFETLPAAPAATNARADGAPASGRVAEPVAKAPSGVPPFGAGVVAPERVVLEEDRPAPRASAAAAAARATAPAETAQLRPAELNQNGTSGDRPSAGAAQAAVGSVLGAARACIAGHSAPSGATLVFSSNGQVERVNVSGPAAGTPAADCVESALKKARVQPFAADSFSLAVTVRPP